LKNKKKTKRKQIYLLFVSLHNNISIMDSTISIIKGIHLRWFSAIYLKD